MLLKEKSNEIKQKAQKVEHIYEIYVIIDRRGVVLLNWLTSTEQAIEYIETHITDKLDYDDIASAAFCSSYHFQRMFSVFAGCTLGEYIRARKMTLAAAELKNPQARIIDVAIKYGYESQEGFARAFTKFHGITPSAAKKKGAKLKSYSRLTVYELDEGGNMLEYSIEELPKSTYAVFKTDSGQNSAAACRKICKQIYCEWLPSTNYRLKSVSDLIVNYSFNDEDEKRFIEIYIPVEVIK